MRFQDLKKYHERVLFYKIRYYTESAPLWFDNYYILCILHTYHITLGNYRTKIVPTLYQVTFDHSVPACDAA